LLSTNPGDLVCDPFAGAGTTAYVAEKLGRHWITSELNDTEPAKLRLLEVANGTDPSWRSSKKRIMESASHVCEPVGSLFSDLQL
jgi:DNA modification methylase